ncbi:MAG TPA: xanthine dehydrogenase family protein molybdopterin-binding subunit [Vicinamibacterales bacterium]|jgi:xanthine dehydrogenase YagR molybdenum-binding subunit
MMVAYIGEPISRVDGRAKVTGQAKYAGEPIVANLVYGYVVSSTIAKGKIRTIDTTEALAVPGVLEVLTHENSPLPASKRTFIDEAGSPGETFIPFRDNDVKFNQQPVALVLADTFEVARYAATLVRVEYNPEAHRTDLSAAMGEAYDPPWRRILPPIPKPRGDADKALAASATRVDVEYRAPAEHHNPMEPYASTAVWQDDGTLTVYDKTQGVKNVQGFLCSLFDYDDDEMRVLSPYVGGAFGSGLRPQYQVFLAVLAARALKRSVKVTLTRQQMFSLCYRPFAWQRVALGTSRDGKLQALVHEAVQNTSRYEHYCESTVHWSAMLYQCSNVKVGFKLAPLDLTAPADMRAPGAAWGLYALESAMDELAVELKIDPLDLRLRNYAERDQNGDVPFSSKALRHCYKQGAERIGWSRRKAEPRSLRQDGALVGLGMATGVWESPQLIASARSVLTLDGMLTVSSATADIGTGTYTIMTQIAAEALGSPVDKVRFTLGDSSLPKAPVEGGSFTAATVGPAVQAACAKVREQLYGLALRVPRSPIAGVNPDEVIFDDGYIRSRKDPSKAVSFADAMRNSMVNEVEGHASTGPSPKQQGYGTYAHSAVFTEVHVDEDLGTIHVARAVSALAAGRILNPKTARSQMLGGLVWGIGMALEEESVIDQKFGRFVNHSLGEYHVPVNADVHDLEVIFVEERDDIVNPLGAKGLGEIGLIGVAAAIGNAVYNATGKRIRELPITLDKLM